MKRNDIGDSYVFGCSSGSLRRSRYFSLALKRAQCRRRRRRGAGLPRAVRPPGVPSRRLRVANQGLVGQRLQLGRRPAAKYKAWAQCPSNSGGRPAKTGLLNYASSSTSATGRRGFCAQFPGRSGPTDNSMTGTSSSASPNSLETDHRRRTQAQRAGRIDHRRRAEGAGAYCLVALALRVLHIQIACGDFPFRHHLCWHDARFHQRCQALWYYAGIGQLTADDEGNGRFGDCGLIPGDRT